MWRERIATWLIMGNGIAGNLAAAWFTRHMPALRVRVVGPAARTLPIVGESLVEFSTQLLQEIGLGRHLVEKQLPKYGLTFYYKLDPATPADPRYVVDAVPTNPPLPSFLVNRFTLDDALQQLNRDRGVEQVDGRVVARRAGLRRTPRDHGAPQRRDGTNAHGALGDRRHRKAPTAGPPTRISATASRTSAARSGSVWPTSTRPYSTASTPSRAMLAAPTRTTPRITSSGAATGSG